MRVTVKLEVQEKTIDEATAALLVKWRRFVNDPAAELPTDAEMTVQSSSTDNDEDYTVFYTGRTRINDGS